MCALDDVVSTTDEDLASAANRVLVGPDGGGLVFGHSTPDYKKILLLFIEPTKSKEGFWI